MKRNLALMTIVLTAASVAAQTSQSSFDLMKSLMGN
jgi:hypothetical protein